MSDGHECADEGVPDFSTQLTASLAGALCTHAHGEHGEHAPFQMMSALSIIFTHLEVNSCCFVLNDFIKM
jgi:hypothetical protein